MYFNKIAIIDNLLPFDFNYVFFLFIEHCLSKFDAEAIKINNAIVYFKATTWLVSVIKIKTTKHSEIIKAIMDTNNLKIMVYNCISDY